MWNEYKHVLIGAFVGLVISIVLLIGQNVDALVYLSAAPYYIDLLTIRSGQMVNVITFVYFISISALAGYFLKVRLPVKYSAIF